MSLTSLKISGSAYDIGFQLGCFGKKAVHQHLKPMALWQWLSSQFEQEKARTMATLVEQQYPLIWQELHGLADGLELPFSEVFMWNCRGDYVHTQSVDGCTTVLGHVTDGILVAHNEDGFPQLDGHCGLADISPAEGPGFISFVYPGSLPGHTFAVNNKGIVITINNIRPQEIPAGLPRMVLCRAALDAQSLDEAITTLSRMPRAGAFHHSLAQAGDHDLYSLEATAHGHALLNIKTHYGHANHLIAPTLAAVKQRVTASSGARQQRLDQLLSGEEGVDTRLALRLLRDTQHQDLPIYRRHPEDPDDENTLATGVFLIGHNKVDWQVYTHAETDTPDHSGTIALN
ncbi:C45 family autoproteolytic acyltransferase/hydolase [Oceanisphaera arctica]|uniref:Acyl-CoA--6-aminopenicillanic acid acyl-transferase n=1 Tax=Oceanisphaera arctica TaxID=641510 RepID=A0A2P5TK52_9GAMM|nr:C45 family peptidase [Oceanisphaera arctica]PPL15423.1 acyl-CoA--6-aminopenicillanic acid acyl-transferase [Oceanisphaera arctica]GHA22509.1 peptidase C45 [Oceanisphaera arctica]